MVDITFFSSDTIKCPVCDEAFRKENVRQGGGRFVAENLNRDLYRNYKKTEKYGKVFPVIYNTIVCPNCFYSILSLDQNIEIDEGAKTLLAGDKQNRIDKMQEIFGRILDFKKNRTLLSGAAGYFLALCSYSFLDAKNGADFKKALCALRLSWVLREIIIESEAKKEPSGIENPKDVYWMFRILARKLYYQSFQNIVKGEEIINAIQRFGPDVDVDFGYHGFLYVMAYLHYEQRDILPPDQRESLLEECRLVLSRTFGIGEKSKEKPSILLESVKELIKDIREASKH